jgi:hypothetical protein
MPLPTSAGVLGIALIILVSECSFSAIEDIVIPAATDIIVLFFTVSFL